MTRLMTRLNTVSAALAALMTMSGCSHAHAQAAARVARSRPDRPAAYREQRQSALDFADEVRSIFPDASLSDVIGLQVQHVPIEFALAVKQRYPSATVSDVVGFKTHGGTPAFIDDIQAIRPTALLSQLIGLRVHHIPTEFVLAVIDRYPSASLDEVVGLWVNAR